MKIQEYKTATAGSCNELDARVNALIAEGFKPVGSPYFIPPHEGIAGASICQAMLKWEEWKLTKPKPIVGN